MLHGHAHMLFLLAPFPFPIPVLPVLPSLLSVRRVLGGALDNMMGLGIRRELGILGGDLWGARMVLVVLGDVVWAWLP